MFDSSVGDRTELVRGRRITMELTIPDDPDLLIVVPLPGSGKM